MPRAAPILFLLALLAANPLAVRAGAVRYETIASGAPLVIAGRATTLDAAARTLLPALYQDPAMPGGPMREALYEARAEAGRLSVLYHLVWDDEIHPTPWMHALYKPFRQLFYGSAKDVECVRVEVDLASGAVTAIDYQTEGRGREAPDFPLHARVLVDGIRLAAPPPLRVQTWNHLFAPLAGPPGPGLALAHPRVRPVEDADRRALYLSRRTYRYLRGFGPKRDGVELAVFGAAAMAALAVGRVAGRRSSGVERGAAGGV
jgi:hypothetical protein